MRGNSQNGHFSACWKPIPKNRADYHLLKIVIVRFEQPTSTSIKDKDHFSHILVCQLETSSQEWPSETYIRDAGLRHFDGVLLVVAGAFSDAEESGR